MNKLLNEPTVAAFKSGNCFDFIRYFFAFSLVFVHFCTICGIEQFWFVSGGTRVKAFFTLSGFLVFYSLSSKPDVRTYVEKRVRRIVPAYAVVILFCFLVGMVLTTLPLTEFLTTRATWKYLAANLSFLNYLQPTLPGVFEGNPQPFLNGSLWSMKVEVAFYVSAPVVYWLMTRTNRHVVLWSVYALCFAWDMWFRYRLSVTGDETYRHLEVQLGSFIYFYAGVAMLIYFEYVMRWRRWLVPLAAVLFFGRNIVEPLYFIESITFACLLVGIAYSLPFLNFLRRYDNISYGIYLYHFPVIQCAISLGLADRNIPLTFIVCLSITLVLATISWYAIEKPILKHKWF